MVSLSLRLSNLKRWWKLLSRVQLFVTPWPVGHQAPLSRGSSRQEYWSGLPFPSPGDLPNPGVKTRSPVLQADSLPSEAPRDGHREVIKIILAPSFLRWDKINESDSCSVMSTLCNSMECSPRGSSVYGILQARKLEWSYCLNDEHWRNVDY